MVNRLVIQAGGRGRCRFSDVYRTSMPRKHASGALRWTILRPSIGWPSICVNMDEVLVSCAEPDRYAWSEVLKGSGVRMARSSAITLVRSGRWASFIMPSSNGISTPARLHRSAGGPAARMIKRLFDIVGVGGSAHCSRYLRC